MHEAYITLGVIGFLTFSFYFYSKKKESEKLEELVNDYEIISIDSDILKIFDEEELENSLIEN